jgi:hypothetical protein
MMAIEPAQLFMSLVVTKLVRSGCLLMDHLWRTAFGTTGGPAADVLIAMLAFGEARVPGFFRARRTQISAVDFLKRREHTQYPAFASLAVGLYPAVHTVIF